MNRPFKPRRAEVIGPRQSEGTAALQSLTFSFRTEPCGDCDRATDIHCETCWNSGVVDAACCVCNRVTALDSDGYCRACAGEPEPVGWLRAERAFVTKMMGEKA